LWWLLVLFQELFCVHGGHATGARSGDGLAITMILHVAGDENTGDAGLAAVGGEQIAIGVGWKLAAKGDGIGIVADGDEHAVNFEFARFAGFGVAEAYTFHTGAVGENFFDDGGRDEFDFFVGAGAVEHDFRGAKFVAAVNQIQPGGVTGEKAGFLHRGIASADDGDGFVTKKEAVASGAGRDTAAEQGALFGKAEQTRGGSRGDDQSFGLVGIIAGRNCERAFGEVNIGDDTGIEFRAESLRLLAHILDQLVAQNAVGEARVIFDHGGQSELSARFMTVDHKGLQIGTRSVDRGGKAGAAAAYDDYVVHFHCSH